MSELKPMTEEQSREIARHTRAVAEWAAAFEECLGLLHEFAARGDGSGRVTPDQLALHRKLLTSEDRLAIAGAGLDEFYASVDAATDQLIADRFAEVASTELADDPSLIARADQLGALYDVEGGAQ